MYAHGGSMLGGNSAFAHYGTYSENNGVVISEDAFFYYLGTYTSANGRWKGEILNHEHTPAKSEHPIFGGHEVGIGVAGTCDGRGALLEATALAASAVCG